jgi:hypothetical protein
MFYHIPDPMNRYMAVPGVVDTNKGVCPRCESEGVVGNLCVLCRAVPDRIIRYLAFDGVFVVDTNTGECPSCYDEGIAGNCCYSCTQESGLVTFAPCSNCRRRGPNGILCEDCGIAKYTDDSPDMGTCALCNKEGHRGTLCTRCEDCSMVHY